MTLRQDAIEIWTAGVQAADSEAAVRRQIVCDAEALTIAGCRIPLSELGRLEVVGAGKAGAGMAAGFEQALHGTPVFERLSGWVNVPDNCSRPLQRIHLHAARPAGRNEPTPAVLQGTQEILDRVGALGQRDVCVMLLSGGGSALLCRPVPEITLEDKLLVTRLLSGGGAPIQELNLVRTQLSLVKGGRLAAACRAGLLVTLVISDVIGDPLESIGSGPTWPVEVRRDAALEVLERRGLLQQLPARVTEFLRGAAEASGEVTARLVHRIVASNTESLAAAAARARELGYVPVTRPENLRGEAAVEGRRFLQLLTEARQDLVTSNAGTKGICLLAGGETTVNVASAGSDVGKGGRNQEFVLAAAVAMPDPDAWRGIVVLSGGTDGEDGPTEAAGAVCDAEVLRATEQRGLRTAEFLRRHDAWTCLRETQGLIITGPTHTNVMDLAVGLVERE